MPFSLDFTAKYIRQKLQFLHHANVCTFCGNTILVYRLTTQITCSNRIRKTSKHWNCMAKILPYIAYHLQNELLTSFYNVLTSCTVSSSFTFHSCFFSSRSTMRICRMHYWAVHFHRMLCMHGVHSNIIILYVLVLVNTIKCWWCWRRWRHILSSLATAFIE